MLGETGHSLCDRFNGHKRDINHWISTNVADHCIILVVCDFETQCKLKTLENLQESALEKKADIFTIFHYCSHDN